MNVSEDKRQYTWWSVVTVALAIPVWWFAAINGVMSRDLDGGVFLSVVGGMDRGLQLYSGVFDNKDPLYFGAMWAAAQAAPAGPFLMDWFWLPVAALGGWLLARQVSSADRAMAVGLVGVPIVVTGGYYTAGLTNTPGTALILLTLGLALARRGLLAGVALGMLLFVKALVWPLALLAFLVLILFRPYRPTALRACATGLITIVVVGGVLWIQGILAPYIDALRWNSSYSFTIMEYFGYESSFIGHLTRLAEHWTWTGWLSSALAITILIAGFICWGVAAEWRTSARGVLVAWLALIVVGTFAVLGLSYVWQHHGQLIFLPGAVALVTLVAMLPERWPFLLALPVLVLAAAVLGAWGTVPDVVNRVTVARDTFPSRMAEIDEVPKDARLLETVPRADFSYARLGTNDGRGYMLAARPDATLACPQFHFYDFSPDEDFRRMLECLTKVDVVLITENFRAFGNGGKAPVVQPILQYVDSNFDCLRLDDRQVCSRHPTDQM